MAAHDVVVIGASSGGVEALMRLDGRLPSDLPATVFAVLHVSEGAPSVLPRILGRAGLLEAVHPEDGELIENGRINVAPPNRHLSVERGRLRTVFGPRENRHRPAIDPLFRSAAVAYGPRVVGAILTGARDDGSAVKRRGGVAVVQDPEDALFSGMPQSALEFVDVNHCEPGGSRLHRREHARR